MWKEGSLVIWCGRREGIRGCGARHNGVGGVALNKNLKVWLKNGKDKEERANVLMVVGGVYSAYPSASPASLASGEASTSPRRVSVR